MTETSTSAFTAENLADPFGLVLRPDVHHDPYAAYAFMREHSPILSGGEGSGMWFVTSNELVDELLNSAQTTTQASKVMAALPQPDDLWTQYYDNELLFTDGQRHMFLRKFANEAFKPRRVRKLRPQLEADVAQYLDNVASNGQMDVVSDLALPFAIIAVMRMIGIPVTEADQVHEWSGAMGALLDPMQLVNPEFRDPAVKAFGECIEMTRELMVKRRAQPEDDVLSDFVASVDAGGDDSLTDADVMGIVIRGMINAGHATTTNQIGNDLLGVLRFPEQADMLRAQPELAPNAIEELFRFDSAIQLTVRGADEPMTVGGESVNQGDLMFVITGAANRDPAAFENPDSVDITRDVKGSYASGGGEHYCLGATLARIETETALMQMLTKFKNIELTMPEAELPRDNNVTVRGVESLPITFDLA